MCGLHVSLVISHTFLLNFGRDSYVDRMYLIMAWQTFPPHTPIYLMSCVRVCSVYTCAWGHENFPMAFFMIPLKVFSQLLCHCSRIY
jgi:hypothetical protein